jgi:Pyridoxamine 5'-phosphate oxidase
MTGPAGWQERAREALRRTEIMVLATADADSGTWTSPVQFQAGENYELSFLSHPGTRHGRNIDRDPRVSASIYSWPGPDGGNLGLQITGHAARQGDACGGWQRYTVRPAEVWCFDSRIDRERHQISIR